MSERLRLLDLFCGAGGAAVGYHRVGFDVVGVDIKSQPRYPFEFQLGDALRVLSDMVYGDRWSQYPLSDFDAIHASPPCPAYAAPSVSFGYTHKHPDLVGGVRYMLELCGLPYVIENVPGAPLRNPIQLCGSSFGLRVRRHRLFECNFSVLAPPCAHHLQRSNPRRLRSGYELTQDCVVPVYGGGQAGFDIATCRRAMGIDWMMTDELNDAIPPAYTEHIGHYLMREALERRTVMPRVE